MRRILRSKKFWGGALVGVVAGPWALGKVGVSLPAFRGKIG
jgi:hypothetical protein